MNPEQRALVAVVGGFAVGAAFGYRSTVNVNRTEVIRYADPEVSAKW